MRIGKYEFGLVQPFGWYSFSKDTSCMGGCVIYTFGPFFLTILNLECMEVTGEDTKNCIVSIEPLKLPIIEQPLNLKPNRREKKLLKKNNDKALPKRKKRISRSKNKR